jgi:hypothetical protein
VSRLFLPLRVSRGQARAKEISIGLAGGQKSLGQSVSEEFAALFSMQDFTRRASAHNRISVTVVNALAAVSKSDCGGSCLMWIFRAGRDTKILRAIALEEGWHRGKGVSKIFP